MARRSRERSRLGRRVRKRQLILEISSKRDPEILKELAEEAMRILEDPEADDFVKAAARGQLAMSAVVYKFWRFFMPPAVQIEFVFEHQRYSDEFAEATGKFMNVKRALRNVDGRTYPAVRVNWQQWHAMKTALGAPIDPVDLIAENFVRKKNPRKALKRLMQDLVLFSMATGTEPKLVDPSEEAEER